MALSIGTTLPGGHLNSLGGPVDPFYAQADGTPWPSLAAACEAVPTAFRRTRTVNVNWLEYWWLTDLSDAGLLPKAGTTTTTTGSPTSAGPYSLTYVLAASGVQTLTPTQIPELANATGIVEVCSLTSGGTLEPLFTPSTGYAWDAAAKTLQLLAGVSQPGDWFVQGDSLLIQYVTGSVGTGAGSSADLSNYYTKPQTQALLDGKASKQDIADLIGAAPAALDTLAEIDKQLQADEAGAAAILATQQQHTQQLGDLDTRVDALEAKQSPAPVAAVTESTAAFYTPTSAAAIAFFGAAPLSLHEALEKVATGTGSASTPTPSGTYTPSGDETATYTSAIAA